MRNAKVAGGLLLLILAIAPAVRAQSSENKFHQAYYLENERGEYAAAARIYDEVANDRRAPKELKTQAQARGQSCQEELVVADFANLMPPNALAYVELNRPGEQLSRLLEMLGLMRDDGGIVGDPDQRLAVSPELIRELLGIRGFAAAITGFNPAEQEPMGVAVLHPGDIGVIRGLIETALPAGGMPEESIAGYPTFNIEDEVLVTLTRRLVIVSTQRHEIEGVAARLRGEDTESLANNAEMAGVLQGRDPSLLFFCVNFKPMMPLINAGMAAAGTQSQELAMAQALLDLQSLKMLTGSMGVNADGLYLDLALQLEQGHRNLAFHFLRLPRIDQDILKRVPAGAAGFLVGALTDQEAQYQAAGSEDAPVTMLDIGREVFANIASFAFFAMPLEQQEGAMPIPHVVGVIKVHDPAKSQALWRQMLGIGSLASGGGALDGMKTEIAGVEAQRFIFPDGISVYLVGVGNDLIISPSKAAIAHTLETRKGGKSILHDPAYAGVLKRVGSDATLALYAHPGRCARIAKPFMSPSDVAEMTPFVELLTETVAAVVMEHSDNEFRFAATVTGLPNIGPFISKMIEQEHRREFLKRELRQARHNDDWDGALEAVREMRRSKPENNDLLWKEFKILAVEKDDREGGMIVAEKLCEALNDDAYSLNQYSWALLTEERYGDNYDDLALKMTRRSNELTGGENWAYVDTLALALFKTGDAAAAVEMEKKALELCGDSSGRDEAAAALERFQAAAAQ